MRVLLCAIRALSRARSAASVTGIGGAQLAVLDDGLAGDEQRVDRPGRAEDERRDRVGDAGVAELVRGRHSATSATAPALRWPSSSSRPRQRAPCRVASSSAWRAVSDGGPCFARATTSAARSSSASSPHSFDAAPSTPSPTGAPAASSAGTGAIPAPSRPLDVGQCATPVPVAPMRSRLGAVEVDAVGEPDVVAEPAQVVEVLQRAHAEALEAERLLVVGLGEVRVQPHAARAGQLGRLAHQLAGDRERRRRRERDPHHRARRGVVEAVDRVGAGGEDRVAVLDDVVGRQPAVARAEVHRAAAGMEAQRRSRARRRSRPRAGRPAWRGKM